MRFKEDSSRVRNAEAAQNLDAIRKVAIDLLRADRTTRHTFKKKMRLMILKMGLLHSEALSVLIPNGANSCAPITRSTFPRLKTED